MDDLADELEETLEEIVKYVDRGFKDFQSEVDERFGKLGARIDKLEALSGIKRDDKHC